MNTPGYDRRKGERHMTITTTDSSINVIIEQLNQLRNSMDEVKSTMKGVETRLTALEINDVSFRTSFDARLNNACSKLGEHDGIAQESRADRKEIRDQISELKARIYTQELAMSGLRWFGGVVVVAVILDIVSRFLHLI